jgi:sortase (surface protein transpeptidase)
MRFSLTYAYVARAAVAGMVSVAILVAAAHTESRPVQAQAVRGIPVRLRIPSIALDADLEQLGQTSRGALDTPHDPMNAGWYADGPMPGQKGTAIIDGHSGWWHHEPAVFDELHALRSGDVIYVTDQSGAETAFTVRDSVLFHADADPAAAFRSGDDLAHLSLITCTGKWDAAARSYPDRLVVFADAAVSRP